VFLDASVFPTLVGASQGTANICVLTPTPATEVDLWYATTQSWFAGSSVTSTATLGSYNTCANVPFIDLVGNSNAPIVVGNSVLPAPEFPLGALIAILVPMLALILFVAFRTKKARAPLVSVYPIQNLLDSVAKPS